MIGGKRIDLISKERKMKISALYLIFFLSFYCPELLLAEETTTGTRESFLKNITIQKRTCQAQMPKKAILSTFLKAHHRPLSRDSKSPKNGREYEKVEQIHI